LNEINGIKNYYKKKDESEREKGKRGPGEEKLLLMIIGP
jgi:hypothetical protein